MGKKRVINSKIRTSQTFASLSYRQRDLWHGLIVVADDQGRLPGVPAYVRSVVFPYDDITLEDLIDDLMALEAIGNILLYVADGAQYIQIIKWWCYQKMQWAGKSDCPPADGWTDRIRHNIANRKIYTENWDHPGGFCKKPVSIKDKVNNKIKDNNKEKATQQSLVIKVDDKGGELPIIGELFSCWLELFPSKPKPKLTTKSYVTKIKTRLKDSEFTDNWREAMTRASQSPHLQSSSWFNFGWFIANDTNWQKCLDRNYQSFDKQHHAQKANQQKIEQNDDGSYYL